MNHSRVLEAAKKAPHSISRQCWRESIAAGVEAYPDIEGIAEEFSDDAKAKQRALGSQSVLFGTGTALELCVVIGGFLADMELLEGKE